MSERTYQYSALLISHDIIAESMAGPGIRYFHLARVLGMHMPTALAVPEDSSDSIPHDNFDLLHYTGGQWATLEPHVAKSRTCIFPSAIADGYPRLASSGACLVVDGYDPLLAEWLELPPMHHPGRFTSEWQKLMIHLGSQYSIGDFYICASERQRDWWLGLLEANGRINPATHAADPSLRNLIDVVAYGMPEEEPVHKRPVVKGVWDGIGEQDKVLVWGGGLWPWLDPVTAIKAVGKVAATRDDVHLIFPGTKHPNPILSDMPTRLADARRMSEALGLTDKHVFFGDWTPYDLWSSLLLESDIALILHLDTLETRLAFRSRVLEYMWCNLPIISSTGDAMSEMVAQRDLGYVVDYEDAEAVADAILHILDEPADLRHEQFAEVRQELTWEKLAAPLINYCLHPRKAADKSGAASGENEYANPWGQLQRERKKYQEIIDGYERGKVMRAMNWARTQLGYLRAPGSRPAQLSHERLSMGGQRVSHLQKSGGYYAQLACYRFAADYCQNQRVLDVGSGDGSGSQLPGQ